MKHQARKDGDAGKRMGGSPTAVAACLMPMVAPAAQIWLGRRCGWGSRERMGDKHWTRKDEDNAGKPMGEERTEKKTY